MTKEDEGDLRPVSTEQKPVRPVSSTGGKPKTTKQKRRNRDGDSNVGDALRSIYQNTVDEAVPAEMLELLGKLG